MLLTMGVACAGEPAAQAKLSAVRCVFSPPHDESGRRMELRVEVGPTEPGWRVNEAGARAQRICGTDQCGNMLTSAPCAWGRHMDNPEARIAFFVFPLSERVDYLLVDEVLHVQLAREPRKLEALNISMVKPTDLSVPDVEGTIRCVPAETNGADANRESDGSLLRANLTLICPAGFSILRVVRVWNSSDKQADESPLPVTQDLEVRHFTTNKGENGTRIVLWNAQENERLQLELCSGQSTVHVPLHFRAMLGDASTRMLQTSP